MRSRQIAKVGLISIAVARLIAGEVSVQSIVGPIVDASSIRGASCSFNIVSSSGTYLPILATDDPQLLGKVLLNIYGKDVELEPIDSIHTKTEWTHVFSTGTVTVRAQYRETGGGYESTAMELTLTASDGEHKQIVSAEGGCGS